MCEKFTVLKCTMNTRLKPRTARTLEWQLHSRHILEVLGSSHFQDTVYPDSGCRGFPQSLKLNARTVPRLVHEGFLTNHFQFIINR
jgi:hypothetical protein